MSVQREGGVADAGEWVTSPLQQRELYLKKSQGNHLPFWTELLPWFKIFLGVSFFSFYDPRHK